LSGGGVAPGPPAVPPVASSFGSELEVVILPPSSRRSATQLRQSRTPLLDPSQNMIISQAWRLGLESWRDVTRANAKRLLTRDTRNCRCGMDEE
jgi:hypothetical protein